MEPRRELGAFLRTRRDRTQPRDLGLPPRPGRRVPGLRREEVAALAGVSADYLRRMEQGRVLPSVDLLDALADALRLGAADRLHLEALADQARGRRRHRPAVAAMRPSLLRTLDALSPAPAVVLGRCCEVLAWNPTGAALDQAMADRPAHERNVARRIVLEPSARELYPEWEALVQEVADVLRLNAARFPDDTALAALIDELLAGSQAFARCWERLDVFEKSFGRKLLDHPVVGRLELTYEAFEIAPGSGQALLVYTAEPESSTAKAIEELARTCVSRPPGAARAPRAGRAARRAGGRRTGRGAP
jgi:transcriptional regulator with XRE-family HTH domain